MRCDYIKQIRTLILVVRYYTQRDVDVVAYSLGVPIARKAILGGECVDTKENLGKPLTAYIDTFVGVAGPNHGISLQIAGVEIPGCIIGAFPILPICSRVIGLYSGLCPTESLYLTDINSKVHYEGRHVYTIYSLDDNWIGYKVCDLVTASIFGEDGHKEYTSRNHDEVLERSVDVQYDMLKLHVIRGAPARLTQAAVAANQTTNPKMYHVGKHQLGDFPTLDVNNASLPWTKAARDSLKSDIDRGDGIRGREPQLFNNQPKDIDDEYLDNLEEFDEKSSSNTSTTSTWPSFLPYTRFSTIITGTSPTLWTTLTTPKFTITTPSPSRLALSTPAFERNLRTIYSATEKIVPEVAAYFRPRVKSLAVVNENIEGPGKRNALGGNADIQGRGDHLLTAEGYLASFRVFLNN